MTEKIALTPRERALNCASFALEKKALDVKILEIGKLSSIADYLVLASGRSDKQTQAIAESVRKGLKKFGKALDVEGLREGNWIVIDYGDVDVVPVDVLATHTVIHNTVSPLIQEGLKVITLGGDHSIALPLLRAHSHKYGRLAVIHFDAHPDTWDVEFGDQKYSHGTPFRRAIEEKLIDTSAYIQIGIRGPTSGKQDYEEAIALGARMITIDDAMRMGLAGILNEVRARVGSKPVYLSFDIDSVDPAFAPGTGTPEVGGFSSYQMLQMVRSMQGLNLVGFDLVEVSPPFDHSNITAILAANLAFEFLSLIAIAK